MKKNFLAATVTCIFFLSACSKTASSKNDKVFIRIQNTTAQNLANLNFMGEDFGSIGAGDTAGYKSFQKVIHYPLHFYKSWDIIKKYKYAIRLRCRIMNAEKSSLKKSTFV